jgi:hypothetical protein
MAPVQREVEAAVRDRMGRFGVDKRLEIAADVLRKSRHFQLTLGGVVEVGGRIQLGSS